jgi:hypothetical protein
MENKRATKEALRKFKEKDNEESRKAYKRTVANQRCI